MATVGSQTTVAGSEHGDMRRHPSGSNQPPGLDAQVAVQLTEPPA